MGSQAQGLSSHPQDANLFWSLQRGVSLPHFICLSLSNQLLYQDSLANQLLDFFHQLSVSSGGISRGPHMEFTCTTRDKIVGTRTWHNLQWLRREVMSFDRMRK